MGSRVCHIGCQRPLSFFEHPVSPKQAWIASFHGFGNSCNATRVLATVFVHVHASRLLAVMMAAVTVIVLFGVTSLAACSSLSGWLFPRI